MNNVTKVLMVLAACYLLAAPWSMAFIAPWTAPCYTNPPDMALGIILLCGFTVCGVGLLLLVALECNDQRRKHCVECDELHARVNANGSSQAFCSDECLDTCMARQVYSVQDDAGSLVEILLHNRYAFIAEMESRDLHQVHASGLLNALVAQFPVDRAPEGETLGWMGYHGYWSSFAMRAINLLTVEVA